MPVNKKGIASAEIIKDHCIGCQLCVGECPVGALKITAEGVAEIDPEKCIGCGKCFEACPANAVRFERKKRKKVEAEAEIPPKEEPRAHQGVAVFIEVAGGHGSQVSWELAGKARELAEKLRTKAIGFLLGNGIDALAGEAVAYGCDEIYTIDHPQLQHYLPELYGKALADLCQQVRPEIFLIGATPLGRDLAGVVATSLRTGLTADCTGLDIEEETGLLLMTRPTFGGNVMATIFCQRHRPQMSTVRPLVMRIPPKDAARGGTVLHQQWVPSEAALPEILDFIPEIPETGSADITRAPALVVAGKGACDPSSFPLLQELADLIGGVVACSRPVVEAGLMPYERQVGQTGKTVAPRLYIGVGVSGAVQHLVAIRSAEKIIAINSDPAAPIFTVADVGIVGDYLRVVPALIEKLKKRMQGRA